MPEVRGDGGRRISERGDKGDETQCSFKRGEGGLNGGIMKVEPSSGRWGRTEEQPEPDAEPEGVESAL